ncbi:MAG: c-type cytochrome [Pontibacterium sp.]
MNKLTISLLLALSASSVAFAGGDAAAGKSKALVCGACHGADGNSAMATFPKLAGQTAPYLVKQLKEIKSGTRPVVEMTGLLDAMSDQDLADIAAFYAEQPLVGGKADPALVETGQLIYRAGIAAKGVAACTACHGPQGKGMNAASFPAVGGQHAAYIEKQLLSFRKGERANDPNAMMRDIAAKLSDAEIKAVASYMQGLY